MNLPFERLSIHALRGIRDLELAGLGRVNLLVGANDSGKTTVLESLALYSDPVDPVMWVQTVMRRDSWAVPSTPRWISLEQFRWLFPQSARIEGDSAFGKGIHLSASGTMPVRGVRARYREFKGIAPSSSDAESGDLQPAFWNTPDSTIESRGAEIHIEVGGDAEVSEPSRRVSFSVWEQRLTEIRGQEGPSVPSQFIGPYDHRLTSTVVQGFSEARLSGLQQSVRDLLHALDPRISGVEILARHGPPTLYLQDSAAGLAPISAFGDGVRRVMLFALALPQAAGGVLLVDELESAIHVSALGRVFRWMVEGCKQFNVQLFATTHSLEALDAILDADTTQGEDIIGYRLERNGAKTGARRYGEDLLKRLRYERGLDVR